MSKVEQGSWVVPGVSGIGEGHVHFTLDEIN